MKLFITRLVAVLTLITVTLMACMGHEVAAAMTAFVSLAWIAGQNAGSAISNLCLAPDTTEVDAALQLSTVLSSALESFKRAILPLSVFSTTFRNVPLSGNDKVEVPYYPLQGIKSKSFAGSYSSGSGKGSKTDTREVQINKRLFQSLEITGRDLARLPILSAKKLGRLKGEALAYDIIQDILSIVTPANFPAVAFTGAAGTFDADDVIDIRTAAGKTNAPQTVADGVTNSDTSLVSATANFSDNDIGVAVTGAGIPANTYIQYVNSATTVTLSAATTATANGVSVTIKRPITPWPVTGRGLIVNPDYEGALLKDHDFRRDLTVAQSNVTMTGQLPNVYGFDFTQSAAIPTANNLVGFAVYQSAILVGFSPIAPPPATRKLMTQYDAVIDAATGIALEYRVQGNPDTDTDTYIIESNYGYAVGEKAALKRLVSA